MGLGFLGPLFMLGEEEEGGASRIVSSHPFSHLATVGWAKFLLLVATALWVWGGEWGSRKKQNKGPHGAATAKSPKPTK